MSVLVGPAGLEAAAQHLQAGRLVAFPTETVYGLGADASNPDAVRRIFAAKGRPADHPVIVHVADVAQLGAWAREVSDNARRLAAAFWPGPLTLILKRANQVSDLVTGGQDTVGLRIPSHPVAQSLLRAFEGGIAAPSANRFGRLSPTSAEHVRAELGDRVDLVLDGGASDVGIESTIVDVSGDGPVLLRPGMIGAAQIEAVLGCPVRTPSKGSPRVSGSLDAHYAPATPLVLLDQDSVDRFSPGRGERVVVLARRPAPGGAMAPWVEAPADPRGYAHELYRILRALDEAGYSRIVIEAPPATPEWVAVRDRLTRAARGAGLSAT